MMDTLGTQNSGPRNTIPEKPQSNQTLLDHQLGWNQKPSFWYPSSKNSMGPRSSRRTCQAVEWQSPSSCVIGNVVCTKGAAERGLSQNEGGGRSAEATGQHFEEKTRAAQKRSGIGNHTGGDLKEGKGFFRWNCMILVSNVKHVIVNRLKLTSLQSCNWKLWNEA